MSILPPYVVDRILPPTCAERFWFWFGTILTTLGISTLTVIGWLAVLGMLYIEWEPPL